MPKVISGFKCQETKRIYRVGEDYDGDHLEEYQERGYVDITEEAVEQPEWPKHTGFGQYELSNGDKIKGKDAALAAQAEIDAAE